MEHGHYFEELGFAGIPSLDNVVAVFQGGSFPVDLTRRKVNQLDGSSMAILKCDADAVGPQTAVQRQMLKPRSSVLPSHRLSSTFA